MKRQNPPAVVIRRRHPRPEKVPLRHGRLVVDESGAGVQ